VTSLRGVGSTSRRLCRPIFAGRSAAPIRLTRPRWRAGKVGADGASPSKGFRWALPRRVRDKTGGMTSVSSDFRGAQPRPHPAEKAALARGRSGHRRSIALQGFGPPPVCQLSGSASKHGIPPASSSFRLTSGRLISRTAGQTEAKGEVAGLREVVVVAGGDSASARIVVPAAAAEASAAGPNQT